jgi:hypothetical protein
LDRLRKQELQRLQPELSEEAYKQLQGVMWAFIRRYLRNSETSSIV